jgi:hypothetical protein
MRESELRSLLDLGMALDGWLSSDNCSVPSTAARRYAAEHPGVRYEWWSEKTGPGTARVAWRLIKEKQT